MSRSMARAALLYFFASGAHVAAGAPQLDALDPSFGTMGDGRQVIESVPGAFAYVSAIDSGRRIVLAGDSGDSPQRGVIARLGINGELDGAFATSPSPLSQGATAAYFMSVAIKPDNGVVAGGIAQLEADTLYVCSTDADGNYLLSFGAPSMPGCVTPLDGLPGYVTDVAVQMSGKILVTAVDQQSNPDRGIVIRLHENGTLDQTFGNAGIQTLPPQYFLANTFEAITIASDGSLAIAGSYGTGGDTHFVVARLSSDGTYLSDFGDGARVVPFTQNPPGKRHSIAFGVHVFPDRSVLLAGATQMGFEDFRPGLVKLGANGNPEENFGTPDLPDGMQIIEFCAAPPCKMESIDLHVDTRGRAYLAGSIVYSELNIRKSYSMRLGRSGLLDAGYGSSSGEFIPGVASVWWPESRLYRSSFQGEKIILTGAAGDDPDEYQLAAVRIRGNDLFTDEFESVDKQ